MSTSLLRVEGLEIGVDGEHSALVAGVHFEVEAGRTLALVGESGSGKTLSALSLVGLLPSTVRVRAGRMTFDGESYALDQPATLAKLRGARIGFVFQEPMSALNPVLRIGEQIAEVRVRHCGEQWRQAHRQAIRLLERVGINQPERRARQYIHELSGGMRQRVMIAIAIACEPRLLIADEPTTALDVTLQRQLLELIGELRDSQGMGVLMVTHDLGVVAEVADRMVVMRKGEIVESGEVSAVLASPAHDYTRGLIAALPGGSAFPTRSRMDTSALGEPLLRVRGLSKSYPSRRRFFGASNEVQVLHAVDLDIHRGETLALVGESGSGKSTLGRCVLNLTPASGGSVTFDGIDVLNARGVQRQRLRQRMQVVFQDPFASLNPRMRVGDAIEEVMLVHGIARGARARDRVAELLELVGLDAQAARRRPHAFSGGQRQRLAIARALALEPELLVADEAVSALDATVRAQVVTLLARLSEQLGLSMLFITHDLGLARHFADRVAVMQGGLIVESGDAESVLNAPQHAYTAALLAAEPRHPV